MKKIIILVASAALLSSCCNPLGKMQKNAGLIDATANPEILTLVGNSVSTDVTVTFPERYFEKLIILKVTPVLVFEGGEITGTPRYFQGERVQDNYTVVQKAAGGTFSNNVVFPYDPRADLSTLEMRVEGRYGQHRRAEMMEFVPVTTIPVARGISTVQSLARPHMVIMPDNFKRITTMTEEAQIHYQINSANVAKAQLTQEQIKLFEEFVRDNQDKERVTMGNVYSKGYASPDGPEKFNDKLSTDRSQSGEKAMKNALKGVDVAYDAAAYGEDWEGFRKLVEASDIQDRDLILQVLAMYDNSAKREQEIRNLSVVFAELKNSILPQLRRTQFVVSADVEGKSDAELVAAVGNNSALNVEELLYAATLVDNKAEVYRRVTVEYPNDIRGWNNYAVELLNQGDVAGAKAAMDRAARLGSNDIITNNLAAVAIAQGDIATAKQYLASLNTADARINRGIVALFEGDYAAATRDLTGYNLAVAQVLNGNYGAAKSALSGIDCAKADYLKAVIAAREGDSRGVIANLRSAVAQNPELAARAKRDIEFAKFFADPDFMAL